jgi:hypothetical protein
MRKCEAKCEEKCENAKQNAKNAKQNAKNAKTHTPREPLIYASKTVTLFRSKIIAQCACV